METVTPKSWKPEVLVEGQWASNALRFATMDEAFDNAYDLYTRWTLTRGYRAAESDEPVNSTYTDRLLRPVATAEKA